VFSCIEVPALIEIRGRCYGRMQLQETGSPGFKTYVMRSSVSIKEAQRDDLLTAKCLPSIDKDSGLVLMYRHCSFLSIYLGAHNVTVWHGVLAKVLGCYNKSWPDQRTQICHELGPR